MISKREYHTCLVILLINAVSLSFTDSRVPLGCPKLCNCGIVLARDRESSAKEWSKVKCSRILYEKLIIKDLNLNLIDPHIIELKLSDNGITHLENSFLKLYSLQKLDLSENEIRRIDDEAFKHLRNLTRLDLSSNNLTELHKEIFEPLQSLERLKLNHNHIVHIYKGVFDYLISLKTLDISDNPFDCDCSLIWVIEWSRNNSVKLAQSPKCVSPPSNKGKPLKKLKLHCDDDDNLYSPTTVLELKPMHDQIVFEGDSLSLRCRSLSAGSLGTESREAQVTWSWENKDPASYFDKVKIENRLFSDNGFVESQLKIDKIQKTHSGDWYCHLLSEFGNHSTAISVIVLSNNSKYCPQVDTRNNKGVYFWPKTIVGFTVDLPCVVKQPTIVGNKIEPLAIYSCSESGSWENLNTTHCPYVSETTRILEQFSQVNLSIAKGSVLDSAIKLRNFTGNGKNLSDAMDIVFISKTIENYLIFVKTEKELGSILMDIVASIMQLPKALLIDAQKENTACSRLVRSVEFICKDIPTFQSHKTNLAVEEFDVTGVFSGIRCIWYFNAQSDKNPKRFFHCSTNNKTALWGNSERIIEASIQIPSSLFSQLEMQGKPHNIWQLIVSMYENNNLFPGSPNANEDVTSCVIGSILVGIDVTNLTDPVYVMLRAPSSPYTATAKPVWWDQSQNNGTGRWTQEGCQPSHYTQEMVVFHCDRFGYFGLLQDTRFLNEYPRRYSGARSRLCHPAIYTGSFILIVCLLISVMTYLISHSFIQMSRRAKHSVVNTWISILLLCFMFICGIYQTENVKICQGIGIILHYLFLSTLLWMSVSASNMYKRLSKSDHLDNTPEDDLPPGAPIQKPILGLYLVGWGIGLIICGISGAVNLKEYAGRNFCFLESGPPLSAVYVPGGILLAFLTLFYILTLCAIRNNDMNGQLSEGTQGTENVDLELLEVSAPMGCVDRRSVQSIVTTDSDDIEDPEHSPFIQLKAHVIVLLLYCFIWGFASLSVTDTFRGTFPYQEDICSILYCILAFCLGAFVLYFYCVARSDVRSQWTILRKIFKGKQIHCCRSRSVSDSHGNIQMNTSTSLPNGPNARQTVSALSSSSVNSSGLTAKSNSHNSNRVKAVKKLNNCDTREDPIVIHSNATNNVNLVAMHRQMYRSNNSMPTYHEISGPDCVEAFYDPRQSIVARKFFKKQRRNKRNDLGLRRRGDGGGTSEGEVSQARRTWRPSAESAVFLSSDMENASEKIGSTFFGYGSKVNNTNIHVGASNRHRKPHSPKNPNILTDSDEENKNKLPLDRLVIGAEEETETSVSLKNNDRISSYDYSLSRVDELSASEEVGSVAVTSSDVTGNLLKTKELSLELLSKEGDPNYERNDVNRKTPDYRTVELQCSLGENSCSDLNSEVNYCDCTINEDGTCNGNDNLNKCEEQDCCSKVKPNSEVNRSVTESGPDCDSFNEKIDGLHLHSDTSISESLDSKTDNHKTGKNSGSQYIKVVDPQFGVVKIPIEQKKTTNRLSSSFDGEQEKEALIDHNDSEKTKKETSV